MPAIDTLRLKTRLSESGMPESQAQVLVEELEGVLSTAISREAATKADVAELRTAVHRLDKHLNELKATTGTMQSNIRELKSETRLLRWMLSIALPILGAIAAQLFFL